MSMVRVRKQAKMSAPVFSDKDPELQVGTKQVPAVDDKGNKVWEDPIEVPYLHFLEVLKNQNVYHLVDDEEDVIDYEGNEIAGNSLLEKMSKVELMRFLDDREVRYDKTYNKGMLIDLCQRASKN